MAVFCSHSIMRKMKMLGYTSNAIAFAHCTDFVSVSVGLHARIPTRVWNSVWWRAAVQWNYYFIRLLKFHGRCNVTGSKADCFTRFETTSFQTKCECSQIRHKWVSVSSLTMSPLLPSCQDLILCASLLSDQLNTLNCNLECVAVCYISTLIL